MVLPQVRIVLSGCALLVACATEATAPPRSNTTTPPMSAIPGVFARACEAQCSGPLAKLTVYRDAKDAIGVVSVQGGPEDCSNAPLLFFGPDGVQRAGIPLVPVAPGSPEAEHYQDIHTTQTAGFHEAESMLCRDVKH